MDIGLAAEELVALDRPAVVHAAGLRAGEVDALLHEGLRLGQVLDRKRGLDRVEVGGRRLLRRRLLEVLERVPDRPGAEAEALELGHLLRVGDVGFSAHQVDVVERDVALLEGLAERAGLSDTREVVARGRAVDVRLSTVAVIEIENLLD